MPLTMTDAGFTDACSILKEHFGDYNQLSFQHLQQLLKLNHPKVLNSRDTECLWDFYNSVQSHVKSLSFLGIDAAKYGIIITPIIISRLPCQLALEWADMSKVKEGDLPHLLTFLQDYVATRQRALCFSTSTSKSFSESTLQERLPTANALTVSEQLYSHSDTTRDRCFTSGKDYSLVSCDQFLKSSVTKRRQAIYNYGACYKCFNANHLAENCPTKIRCHLCDAPHHPLLYKLGDRVHSSDETNTSKFNNSSSFTGENRSLGLVRRRLNKAVNVSGVSHSRDIVAPSSDSRKNSLVESDETNDSVYTNLNVPPNYARDSGQERQDSLQHQVLVSHNNINVSLAERQTVSGDRTEEETEFPGFIGLITKTNNTILLHTICVPLTTRVEKWKTLISY